MMLENCMLVVVWGVFEVEEEEVSGRVKLVWVFEGCGSSCCWVGSDWDIRI